MSVALHLMVTSICDRDCKYCCNKQYDLNDVPYVTDEELRNVEDVFITGGEPFLYSNPCQIAKHLHLKYPNIKNVIVYTNAVELAHYLKCHDGRLFFIDGLTVSIKNDFDKMAFEIVAGNQDVAQLKSNWLYVFPGYEDVKCPSFFTKSKREWQEKFVAAPNSIFRRI